MRYVWLALSLSWDLFLAVVPWPLGRLFAGCLRAARQDRFLIPLCFILGGLWLAFLPNSVYVLTEWRHIVLDPRSPLTLHPGLVKPDHLAHTVLWVALLCAYTPLGAVFFVLAVRPVEAWVRERGWPLWLVAPVFFYVVSLGVYVGFGPRLNSWDLFTDPNTVKVTLLRDVLIRPVLVANGLFAAVTWLLFVVTGFMLDGAQAWWKRRASAAQTSGPADR